MSKAVEVLNRAFDADPSAIHCLMINRVPCNQALADDPTVVVNAGHLGQDTPHVGALGLINGVLGAMGLPLVAMKWSPEPTDAAGRHLLLGFQEYNP